MDNTLIVAIYVEIQHKQEIYTESVWNNPEYFLRYTVQINEGFK